MCITQASTNVVTSLKSNIANCKTDLAIAIHKFSFGEQLIIKMKKENEMINMIPKTQNRIQEIAYFGV